MDCPHTMRATDRDDVTRCCDCGMITAPPEAWRDDVERRLRLLSQDSHPPIDLTPLVEEVLARRSSAHAPTRDVGEWVTVPRVPTETMLDTGAGQYHDMDYQWALTVYSAMIAAAPPSPEGARAGEDSLSRISGGDLCGSRDEVSATRLPPLTTFPLPVDDDARCFSDSLLPRAMIDAGAEVLDRAAEDLAGRNGSDVPDWDTGMEAVGVWRAMSKASIEPPLRCKACNAPRSKSPCHKCGGPLFKPAGGWVDTKLSSVEHIRALAREVGYGIGAHGSFERDLDLIAAPWVAEAVSPHALVDHICAGLPGRIVATFDDAPHGRIGFNIQQDGWFKLIDLSVMPPVGGEAVHSKDGQREPSELQDGLPALASKGGA